MFDSLWLKSLDRIPFQRSFCLSPLENAIFTITIFDYNDWNSFRFCFLLKLSVLLRFKNNSLNFRKKQQTEEHSGSCGKMTSPCNCTIPCFVFPGRWAIPFRRIYSGAIQVWLKPVRPDQRSSIRETMGRNTSCWLHSWRQWKHYIWVTASGMTLILQDPSAVLTVRPVFWKMTCSEIFVELYRLNVYVVEN